MGILIVEDSAFQARILYELLKPSGSAIFIAANPEEAFDILQTVQITLVVSDVHLPRKEDGLSFIRQLRSDQRTAHLEVFACTVDAEEETENVLRELGVRKIFIKPYNANEMIQAVREIFWCQPQQQKTEFEKMPFPGGKLN